MKRPNILFITSDQHRADHLGVEGLSAIHTPNLDRIAGEGIHFRRAYTPSPTCTPARVSMLTGQWPSRHGAYTIGVTPDPFPSPTVADLLAAAGYRTALFGKSHFVSRRDEAAHMMEGSKESPDEFFRRWSGPYAGFEEFRGSTGHTTNCVPDMHYRVFLEQSGASPEDLARWFPIMAGSHHHQQCGPWDIPEHLHDTHWVAGLAEDYIREAASRPEPWFLWASFQDPHEPFRCPEQWFSKVRTERMQIPEGYREGEFRDRHPIYQASYDCNTRAFDDEFPTPCTDGNREWTQRREVALQATLGMVGFLDDRIGRLLATLEETGQLDNTLIVYTSDHGEMHGHHGLWGKGAVAYEDCQRVPLLVLPPRAKTTNRSSDAIVNLVDLPATFLEVAGCRVPGSFQGRSLVPLMEGGNDTSRTLTKVECRATKNLYQQTLVTQRYKLVVYSDSAEGEIYDLEEDPDQYRNLWREKPVLREELLLQLVQHAMQHEGVLTTRRGFG